LSPKQLGQLERARTAHRLIQQRVPLAQAAVEAGYCSKAPMS
jgi:methylphosphotriester-DNA--protein-cysteine methyltransferase